MAPWPSYFWINGDLFANQGSVSEVVKDNHLMNMFTIMIGSPSKTCKFMTFKTSLHSIKKTLTEIFLYDSFFSHGTAN